MISQQNMLISSGSWLSCIVFILLKALYIASQIPIISASYMEYVVEFPSLQACSIADSVDIGETAAAATIPLERDPSE